MVFSKLYFCLFKNIFFVVSLKLSLSFKTVYFSIALAWLVLRRRFERKDSIYSIYAIYMLALRFCSNVVVNDFLQRGLFPG